MNNNNDSLSNSEEDEKPKNASSLVKEISAFFHREIKNQDREASSLSAFTTRISRNIEEKERKKTHVDNK